MAADFYDLLGVGRNATEDQLKKAFRRLARQHHPDANPDDADAETRFKEIALAYETLSDPQKRAHYDRFGAPPGAAAGRGGGGGSGDDPFSGMSVGEIFDVFFGSNSPFAGGPFGDDGRRTRTAPQRGADLEAVLTLDFAEAVLGTDAEVTVRTAKVCEMCEGGGAADGAPPVACGTCNGSGQMQRVRQSALGQMVTRTVCEVCSGTGEVIANPCSQCRGEGRVVDDRDYTVTVPAGVGQGSTLRVVHRGAAGLRGGPPGDLYVHIEVRPHNRFQRDGDNLVDQLRLSMAQAALGVEIKYETLDSLEDLDIPPGTQSGQVFCIRGRGVPRLEGRGRGDLLVQAVVDTPTRLSDEEIDLLHELAELRGEEVAPTTRKRRREARRR